MPLVFILIILSLLLFISHAECRSRIEEVVVHIEEPIIDIEAAKHKRWRPHIPPTLKTAHEEFQRLERAHEQVSSVFGEPQSPPPASSKKKREPMWSVRQDQASVHQASLISEGLLGSSSSDQRMKKITNKVLPPEVRESKFDEPEPFIPEKVFTDTANYLLFFNFWEGLGLVDKFVTADECKDSVIYFIDDIIDVQNNFTMSFNFTKANDFVFAYPIIRFTELFGKNFSTIFPNCYQFLVVEGSEWAQTNYEAVNSDFNLFLQSVLFSAMGNANKIKNTLDQIEEYNDDQQVALIANEYGQLLNILINFEPISAAGIDIPDLERYNSFGRAIEELNKQFQHEFARGWDNISTGEKAAVAVTVASGLGIATVSELNKLGILTNEQFQVWQERLIENFQRAAPAPLYVPRGESPPVVSNIFYDYFYSQTPEEFGTKVRSFFSFLEINGPLPDVETAIVDDIGQLGTIIWTFFQGLFTGRNTERMDGNEEAWNMIMGFKDGAVNVTGPTSLLSYCNGNVSSIDSVYWERYQSILKSETLTENFGTYDDFITSVGKIMGYIEDSLQLPFNITSNCYWATRLIYLPIVEQEQERLFWAELYENQYEEVLEEFFIPELNNDCSFGLIPLQNQKVNLCRYLYHSYFTGLQIVMDLSTSVIFNLGYILNDSYWLLSVEETETSYWYRNGYVSGDIFSRFFIRNTYSAPVK